MSAAVPVLSTIPMLDVLTGLVCILPPVWALSGMVMVGAMAAKGALKVLTAVLGASCNPLIALFCAPSRAPKACVCGFGLVCCDTLISCSSFLRFCSDISAAAVSCRTVESKDDVVFFGDTGGGDFPKLLPAYGVAGGSGDLPRFRGLAGLSSCSDLVGVGTVVD